MFSLFISLLASSTLWASEQAGGDFKGYVDINGKEIWVEYKAPQQGAPLLVLLNGLTYGTEQWSEFNKALLKTNPKVGLLNYDMQGQGRTLAVLPNANAVHQEFYKISDKFFAIHDYKNPQEYFAKLMSGEMALDTVEYLNTINRLWGLMAQMQWSEAATDIHYKQQSKDLHQLVGRFRGNSDVHIAGLSYGGAIGMQYISEHPQSIESLTLMAPFIERLAEQDNWIRIQIRIARTLNPLLYFTSTEKLYDFFLKILVYSTYPRAEPIILENPLKLEAVYRLAKGAKDFQALDIVSQFPKRKVHLMVALGDEYVPKSSLDKLWEEMKSSGASRIYLKDTNHKIPEETPSFSADWLNRILKNDPELKKGRTFTAEPQAINIEANFTPVAQNLRVKKTSKKISYRKTCRQVFL